MNRYYEALTETAARMTELAKRLDGPKGRPLTVDERRLIRLAVLPQAQAQLDGALNLFLVGRDVGDGDVGPLHDFLAMASDLRG